MSNKFSVIFDEVAGFLRSKGITAEISIAEPATSKDVEDFRRATGVELPASFADFFTTFSNGYGFKWESGEEAGELSMPSLERIAEMHREWVQQVTEFADDPGSMNQCIDLKYRANAFQIWERMKRWIPFIEEDEGDNFCLDLASEAIVFDKHDWFDGFGEIAETNGMTAGSSLFDFVQTWGRFCFIPQWFTDATHPAGQTHLDWLVGDSEFERKI